MPPPTSSSSSTSSSSPRPPSAPSLASPSSPRSPNLSIKSDSPSPARASRQLFSGALAPGGGAAAGSASANSSGSGSGRGRRTARSGSVQARRSAASLGLGVHFANMNELTRGPSASPSPTASASTSPVRAPPPSAMWNGEDREREPGSRRSSVHFAATTTSPSPTAPAAPVPSRRPSLTHLASFLSGITHHTRVRSPGPSGGRGVSRSASRSHSRAGSQSGRERRRRIASGDSGVSSVGEGAIGSDDGWDDGDGDYAEPDPVRGFDWFAHDAASPQPLPQQLPHPQLPTLSAGPFRTPSLSRSRVRAASRTSSIASRSRRSSVASQHPPGTPGGASPHPLLHELVRENTTGGVAPSPTEPGAPSPSGGSGAAGAPSAASWEATNEVYKPSVLTTPRPPPPDEEPFLDSAQNSPAGLARTKTYASSASGMSDAESETEDLRDVDVFDEGERVGVGVWLDGRGGYVRDCFAGHVDVDGKAPGNGLDGPRQLEVERRLGEGTYAIVYLVREVLEDPDPTLDDLDGARNGDDDDMLSPIDPLASFEFDEPAESDGQRPRMHSWASETWNPMPPLPRRPTYGQYYALKCLCKKNLTEDLIEVQRNEAFLHRALPKHDNIVQMYGAYETDDWLFLVLEYAGGRDAFYWLLEAQEHGTEDLYSRAASPADNVSRRTSFDLDDDDDDDADESALSRTITADTPAHLLVDETPPSPSLLSAAMGDQLLSRKRLRLISRMFGQMCAAVQACHERGISHRDIKPENFIVIDGKGDRASAPQGHFDKRKGVVVKITDWGLGTMDAECEDFDCGSKPYMAYECRNNLKPTYDPRQADVWSLGLVLLNLLYHRNPWADPSLDDPDFAEYVEDPVGFMQNRFEGMSDEVANFLADRVFCDVLEVVDGQPKRRVSAGEFGRWASRLVMMMGEGQLGAQHRPQLNHQADSAYSAFEFSPVATMPLTIGGTTSPVPQTASLLSQFAPSTVKQSSIFDDLPSDLRHDLPTVPEVPDSTASSFSPSTFPASTATQGRPPYITSPTALSEDGDSLPSPTFPSPALPNATISSPSQIARPLPWASPDLSPRAASPATPPITSPSAALAPSIPPTPSGLTLLAPQAAVRRPSLVDAQSESVVTVVPEPKQDGVDTPERSAAPAVLEPVASEPSASEPPSNDNGDDAPSRGVGDEACKADEEKENGGGTDSPEDEAAKAAPDKAHKAKRRKRGARKEKRAARHAERATDTHGATSPTSPASPRSGKLATVSEGRDAVLDDLAAASQELARELSHARSASSHRSARPRPVPSSRSHGTQSTSAIPTALPQDIPVKKSGGVFGRLKTLVNEGNSDLEAFKRRVDERNASIGAKADTYSAPAQMQGAKAPRGKYDSPFSSRGSVGTTASVESDRGRSSAQHDHWSSASTRRDRLADRRVKGSPLPANGIGGTSASDFSPTSSSLTRGGGPSTVSGFDSTSRTHTPLSSFSSVGSPSESGPNGALASGTTSMSTVREWRRSPSPPAKRPYSHSRAPPGLAPPIGLVASSSTSASPSTAAPVVPQPAAAAPRPKLRDASTDTSDLGSSTRSPAPASPTSSRPSPAPTVVPLPQVVVPPPTTRGRKDPPRAVVPPAQPASAPVTPVLSPASAPGISPASTPGASSTTSATPGKTNKLAKMLNSISVFNRTQPAAGPDGAP
ncbi:hypothetical protein JCM9279_006262 [Rhodotorula babjevae]